MWNPFKKQRVTILHKEDVVVIPYAGDIDPGQQKKFDEFQQEQLLKLEDLKDNGYEVTMKIADAGIHSVAYYLSKEIIVIG